MMQLGVLFSVGLGGFLGAVLRFLISGWIQKSSGSLFPFGTLGVNIIGSFVIGFLFLYFQHVNLSLYQKVLLVTGLLGALTTFSTFSWETLLMLQGGEWSRALINILLNVSLSMMATFMGIALFKKIYAL
jgi:CrcB protein